METLLEKNFTRYYALTCLLVFIVICLRAFFIPFSHDEASTFFFYVQSDNYLPYKAHVYTNNHVLNSALANICYHLAGSHRFVLRIPNILSFLILCLGVFKFFKYLRTFSARVILASFFILTFNFLDFFELCRGYGLSLAFMVIGLAYLQDYFEEKDLKRLIWFSLFWQLALAANLILVVVLTMLLVFVYVFQARHKLLFAKNNIILQVINLAILIFWIKFSLFYKKQGVLDSGIGDNYWDVSFKTLMYFIYGTDYLWMQGLVLCVFLMVLLTSLVWFFKKVSVDNIFSPRFFYIIFLCGLVIAFYLQKKLLGVNYPEDRTGLFYYVFFALSVAVFFDRLPKTISYLAAGPLLVGSLVYFTLSFNLSSFSNYFYHVMPKQFYGYLEQEYAKNQQLFTIGGHTNREMNYAFANYRGGGMLNPMDEPRHMFMNCDYYFALKEEKPYYQFFYDEVAYDTYWDRVLLKRKQKIERRELKPLSLGPRGFNGNGEFFEFLRFNDSLVPATNCLEADLSLSFKKVHKPFKAFLVFEIKNRENGNTAYYKRILLNWIADDLSGMTKRFKLTTGAMPTKYEAVVYIWNIDKKETEMMLNDLKIFELHAPGINTVVPPDYYPYIEKLKQKHLL